VEGFGLASIIPTGWATPDEFIEMRVNDTSGALVADLGSRAYFANGCTAGVYNHTQYLAFNLLGKKMKYTTDMSGLGCGCNAAFYLTSMHQNREASECSDYYCDANNVCGQSCAEIDIQEGNKFSWHTTLHAKTDHGGVGKGYGGGGANWNGPRDWSSSTYGPGASCIDTMVPFQVEVAFPADASCQLTAMEVTLSQAARSDCQLKVAIDKYDGMPEMSAALSAGMTPIASYWASADMLWMDGKGADGMGACASDSPHECGKQTTFSKFSVESIPGSACVVQLTSQGPAKPAKPAEPAAAPATKTTTTTAFIVDEGGDSVFQVPPRLVGPLGFLAGALCAALPLTAFGYFQKQGMERVADAATTQRTFQTSSMNSNSLMSMASIAEMQESEQQA
jgi:hypothetical protein